MQLIVRFFCTRGAASASYNASCTVKKTLRAAIYEKLLRLGGSYTRGLIIGTVVRVEGSAGSDTRKIVVAPNDTVSLMEEALVVFSAADDAADRTVTAPTSADGGEGASGSDSGESGDGNDAGSGDDSASGDGSGDDAGRSDGTEGGEAA